MEIKIVKIIECTFQIDNFIIKLYADDKPFIIRMSKKNVIEKLELKKQIANEQIKEIKQNEKR